MNTRRQKRFSSEKEITDRIDLTKLKITAKNAEATSFEKQAAIAIKEHWELLDSALVEASCGNEYSDKLFRESRSKKAEYFHLRDEAIKARKIAKGLEENILPKLKNTLAAFQTQPMAFLGEDQSVVYGK